MRHALLAHISVIYYLYNLSRRRFQMKSPKHHIIKQSQASLRRTAAVALVLVASLAIAPFAANGAALGGKWATPTYTYYRSVNGYTAYSSSAAGAAAAWNSNTAFNVVLGTVGSAVWYNVNDYGVTDWLGIGEPGPNATSGTYTNGSIRINAGWLDTRHFNCTTPGAQSCAYAADDANQRQCVSAHEMGHIIGLAHTGVTTNTIMNVNHGDRCHAKGLTGPTAGDSNDVNAIYS